PYQEDGGYKLSQRFRLAATSREQATESKLRHYRTLAHCLAQIFFLLVSHMATREQIYDSYLRVGFLYSALLFTTVQAQNPRLGESAPQELQNHYQLAQRYEQSGDWPAAEKEWRQALAVQPHDARAWTNLGVTLNKQNKTTDAIEAWKKAIEI